jgi:hypothetical protein
MLDIRRGEELEDLNFYLCQLDGTVLAVTCTERAARALADALEEAWEEAFARALAAVHDRLPGEILEPTAPPPLSEGR